MKKKKEVSPLDVNEKIELANIRMNYFLDEMGKLGIRTLVQCKIQKPDGNDAYTCSGNMDEVSTLGVLAFLELNTRYRSIKKTTETTDGKDVVK